MPDVDAGQVRRETEYITKHFRHRPGPGGDLDTFPVASQPQSAYRLASFVGALATCEEHDALSGLLYELWLLNEEHVGEPILQVNIYFALTGTHERLENSFMQWLEGYFTRRVKKENPKDKGNSFQKFMRLYREFAEMFGIREHAIDHLVLDKALCRVLWLLFENTWKDCVRVVRESDHHNTLQVSQKIPVAAAQWLIQQFGFGRRTHGLARHGDLR